jgi:hypothetical protein
MDTPITIIKCFISQYQELQQQLVCLDQFLLVAVLFFFALGMLSVGAKLGGAVQIVW